MVGSRYHNLMDSVDDAVSMYATMEKLQVLFHDLHQVLCVMQIRVVVNMLAHESQARACIHCKPPFLFIVTPQTQTAKRIVSAVDLISVSLQ